MNESIEQQLEKNGMVACNGKGLSMEPFLHEQIDKVIITKVNRDIEKYDVVLYKNKDNKYVLHRVKDIKEDLLLIRGDNNIAIEKLKKSQIIGILTGYYNSNGYVDVDRRLNEYYFNSSKATLLYRKAKARIRKLINERFK